MTRVAAAFLALALVLPAPAAALDRDVAAAPDAQDATAAPSSLGVAAAKVDGRDGFILPFAFYTPDTHFGVGGTAGIHLRLRPALRTSSLFATGIYTLRGQGALDLLGQVFPSEKVAILATARATHFPNAFYGIGPRTRRSDREDFTQRYVELAVSGERTLAASLRAGPRLHVRGEDVRDLEPDGALASGAIPGAAPFRAIGLGGGVTWDDRDNLFSPERGRLAEVWYLFYARHAEEAFGRAGLDVRGFTSPWPGHVLAAQAYAEIAHGTVPFTMLPRFGGSHRMRGYPEGRYRDRVHYALQGEWRFPLWQRLGGVAFATAGDVAPTVDAFDLADAKLSAGAGLRFRLTREGAAARFDVAAARDGVSYYAIVLQAF